MNRNWLQTYEQKTINIPTGYVPLNSCFISLSALNNFRLLRTLLQWTSLYIHRTGETF